MSLAQRRKTWGFKSTAEVAPRSTVEPTENGARSDHPERMAPGDHKLPTKPQKPKERRVSGAAELNDRLFEKAWRKGA